MAQVIAAVIACLLLAYCGYVLDEHSCKSKADKMGLEYDFAPGSGCMIKVDGKWLPMSQYRVLGDVD